MRTIAEAREDVAKCWGTQKLKESDYRPILYLVRAECDEGTLVLNTVTGQMVLLTAEELTALDALPGPLTVILHPLMEAHYVVPVDFDEKKSVNQLRALLLRLNRKKEITSYTILPTTACNARCFYCYEANYAHHTMTEETANQVVEFIATHCGVEKKVSLHWFGGEPMVGRTRIDQICEGLKAKGIEFTSGMVSNGYLYTPELAQHAKDSWNLKQIQITLDGTEDVYNKAKAYVNVSGSPYRKVLDNIRYLLDAGVRVSIRMNMDAYNAENLKQLIHELEERFSDKKKLSAYCHILFDNMGFDPISHSDKQIASLEVKYNEIEAMLHKTGLVRVSKSLPAIKCNRCMADSDNSLLINPLGELGKCEHNSLDHLVGTITCGFTDNSELKEWKKPKQFTFCSTCSLYPNCIILSQCEPERECMEVNIKQKLAKIKNSILLRYQDTAGTEEESIESCS